MLPHKVDILLRVGETLLCRTFLIVRCAIAVHVALADERSLAFPVADCGEDLGCEVDRAVPAASRRASTNDSVNDALVCSSCVLRVGELSR